MHENTVFFCQSFSDIHLFFKICEHSICQVITVLDIQSGDQGCTDGKTTRRNRVRF